MANKDEFNLQCQIAEYIRLQYPGVIFLSTLNGIKLPIGQAAQAAKLQCGRGLPDMVILEPRRGYHGLCGEVKTGKSEVYRKDGGILRKRHIREQGDMLLLLHERGYHASFWFGFDGAREYIDWYLSEAK